MPVPTFGPRMVRTRCAPFILGAIALAAMQWEYPTGPLVIEVPGTMAWGFGDDRDSAATQIIEEQSRAGFNAPDGWMVGGLPLEKVRH